MPPRARVTQIPRSFGSGGGPTLQQKADEWRKHIRTNPKRVVAVHQVSPAAPSTSYGDDFTNAWPALLVVMEAARGNMIMGTPVSKEWAGLVEAGVVPVLCKGVIAAQVHPDSPKEAKLARLFFHSQSMPSYLNIFLGQFYFQWSSRGYVKCSHPYAVSSRRVRQAFGRRHARVLA